MQRIGAVSYLNSRPLISGLELEKDLELETAVPSRLLSTLLSRRVDIALCPVIDYQTAPAELTVVGSGAIGSDGTTLTVRLFSRLPFDRIQRVRVDADSHTSVALLQVVLTELGGRTPEVVRGDLRSNRPRDEDEALLLIGDKVMTGAPDRAGFPHQLDLGEAWKEITGLPFVFATWMAHVDSDLGHLPGTLERVRRANLTRLDEIARCDGPDLGWTIPQATRYLAELLSYELGPRQIEAMGLFWHRCHELGVITRQRPLRLYQHNGDTGTGGRA